MPVFWNAEATGAFFRSAAGDLTAVGFEGRISHIPTLHGGRNLGIELRASSDRTPSFGTLQARLRARGSRVTLPAVGPATLRAELQNGGIVHFC